MIGGVLASLLSNWHGKVIHNYMPEEGKLKTSSVKPEESQPLAQAEETARDPNGQTVEMPIINSASVENEKA